MKLQRHAIPVRRTGSPRGVGSPRRTLTAAVTVATVAVALAACGTDNNSGTPDGSGTRPAGGTADISCASGTLTAQGSTAQQNAINQWINDYQTACSGATITYQGTGSGAGQQAFISGTADFAGSDSALTEADQPKADARCGGGPAIHLPMAVGPIAVAYHLDGVSDLRLTPATLAKIFAGTVTSWDDPSIKRDNPDATLPATKILTVHRSDSSGTSDNFTTYLSTVAPADWTFGHDKAWKAPGGTAEKGSDGISARLARTDGAIGYVEWSFAQVNDLDVAKIGNGAGEFAELTGDSAGATIASAAVTPGSPGDLRLSIDYATSASGAYPIVLVTYEIVCAKGNPADALPLLKGFLGYAASVAGQRSVTALGYAPLPESVRVKVATAIDGLS